jgi:hypothetical protein
MRSLYRGMNADGDYPEVASSAKGLGVRTSGDDADIVPDANGLVHPGAGMSVSPNDPNFLPRFRRPREHGGGTAKHPVWAILEDELPDALVFVPDSPEHGVIGPVDSMPVEAYEAALAETQRAWRKV